MDEALLGALANTAAAMETKNCAVTVAIVEGIAYAMRQLKANILVDILVMCRLSQHAGLCGSRVGGLEPLRHIGLLGAQGTDRHIS